MTARRRIVPAVVAAAVVAAVLIAIPWNRGSRTAVTLEAWLPVDSESTVLRSVDPSGDAVYGEALAAYARHDARRVVALLEGRPIPPAHEPMTLLLASALVIDGRPADARARLEAMDVPTLPQPARDRARWTLAAALLGEGRAREAREQLLRLAESPEFSGRAREALAALGRN